MDANAARELFRKYHAAIKDLWIEKQVCRNLVLDRGVMSESELGDNIREALRTPEYRRLADAAFASPEKSLSLFGARAALEELLSKPPSSDKDN